MKLVMYLFIFIASQAAHAQSEDCITYAEQDKITVEFKAAIIQLDANAIYRLLTANPRYKSLKDQGDNKAILKDKKIEANQFIAMLKKYKSRQKLALEALSNPTFGEWRAGKDGGGDVIKYKTFPNDVCVSSFSFKNKEKEDFDNIPDEQIKAKTVEEHFQREPKYFSFGISKHRGGVYLTGVKFNWWFGR